MSNTTQVIIIGAGLAGSALALALDARGIDVALVERGQGEPLNGAEPPLAVTDFDARVSAISPKSWRFLQTLMPDQLDQIRRQPYTEMTVWDAEGTGAVNFDAAQFAVSDLGSIIENRLLIQALATQLAQSRVRVLRQRELVDLDVQAKQIEVTLSGDERWCAQLIIGADGALSKVRDLMQVPTREWSYEQSAIIATIRSEQAHRNTARQWFLRTGPLALLPLANPNSEFCSIVWSAHSARADHLMGLSDDAFCAELTAASESSLGQVQEVSQRQCVPLRQRHAVDYGRARCVLVADAAHTIHPLAGQGINLGFADVAVLAAELVRAWDGGQDLGSMTVLERYQRRRKSENLAAMAAMEGFVHLFDRPEPLVRWARNVGMTAFDRFQPVKQAVARLAMGIA